ncbi:MAG: ADOP family duplicated permease [Gemmatimonadales bacterium]
MKPLRWFWRRREEELDEEIQTHLRMAVQERMARGEDPATAAREARREFGNVTRVRETTRAMWAFAAVEQGWRDLRYALRGFRRTPGFTVVTIASLAVGLGGTATAFTWVDSFLLRPFPGVRQADRLVAIHAIDSSGQEYNRVSYPQYLAWRQATNTLSGLVVFNMGQMSLRFEGAAERAWVQHVSADYFEVLGVGAALGRTLLPEDERQAALVAVISDGLWRHRFRADSLIVGRAITLNGQGVTIVGVTPPGFRGTMMGTRMDAWVPVTTIATFFPGNASLTTPGWFWLTAAGRLRVGATAEQAAAELATMAERSPGTPIRRSGTAAVRPISQEELGKLLHPLLFGLLGVAAAVLLVACTNAASLLIARGATRTREIGVRLAMGASRGRLVTQLLIETGAIAVAGGVGGLALALAGRRVLGQLMPPLGVPVELESQIGGRSVVFLFVLVLGATLMCGLLPALRTVRADILPGLREGLGATVRRSRLRSGLIVGQVATSVMVLFTAGLLVRSLSHARAMDPGFRDPRQLLLVSTDFTLANVDERQGRAELTTLIDRVRTLSGVSEATYTTSVPMNLAGGLGGIGIRIPGYQPAAGESMVAGQAWVGARYFSTLGSPMVAGRDFDGGDREGGRAVAVVNETFVRRYLRGREPIGLEIEAGGRQVTVIGVAKDTKAHLISEAPEPFLHFPHPQSRQFWSGVTLIVRTVGDPTAMIAAIRRAFASVDADLPPLDPRTMHDNMASSFFVQSIGAQVLGALGAVTLLLAAIGLYAVLGQTVSQRRREIGLRMALGAGIHRVIRMVVGDTYRLLALGMVVGSLMGLGAGRLISGQLFGVRPTDLVAFAMVVVTLTVAAAIASLVPVRRATRIDPMTALRLD